MSMYIKCVVQDYNAFLQDFWGVVQSDPRGGSVDKGNMKLAFESVSQELCVCGFCELFLFLISVADGQS